MSTPELIQSNVGSGIATQSVENSRRMWYAAMNNENRTPTTARKITSATFLLCTANPPVRSCATPERSGNQGFSVNLAKRPTLGCLACMNVAGIVLPATTRLGAVGESRP